MYARLLALLLAFLALAAAGEGGGDDGGDGGGGDGGDGGDAGGAGDEGDEGGGEATSFDDLLEAAGDDPPGGGEEETPRERDQRVRAERAERELADRSRVPSPPAAGGGGGDPEHDREEAELARLASSGATENDIGWARWRINQQRELRTLRNEARQSRQEALEVADRVEFGKIEQSNPKAYRRYAEKVEAAIRDLRARGQAVPPRQAILQFMLGQDILKGNVKPKKKSAAGTGNNTSTTPRGKMPGARSDTNARSSGGGKTERDKRRERLENVQL